MKKNIYKKQNGFSLIETLIAVSILMIAITGPLSLVQAGLFSSNHQRNQVTAMYLAQEALEYIKNFRDTNSYTQYLDPAQAKNWLTGPDRAASLLDTCGTGCYVDPHGKLPVGGGNLYVRTGSGDPLRQPRDTSTGVFSYSYDNGPDSVDSPYTRTVTITSIVDEAEVKVSVTVGWKDNLVERTYTVSENIFNYEQP